ncbi:myoglobin-like [Polypterus senegalus]|uniref:myoglobin-like n=1 Tax=Polypterus senegalus TaxID=55291 RepID=UPI0019632CAA|nr:myoglobin-like [Polypterus senegalus]
MAMSEGDWDVVLKVWAKVESDPAGVGQAVLLRLFEDHRDAQEHFPKFKNLSRAELQNCPGVRTHGEAVVNRLTEVFKLRGGHAAIVKKMAGDHSKTLKIPLQYFELISEVIMKVMVEKIPDLGPDVQAAVRKALKVFTNDISSFY